jgi:16S rRNA processing protein RimM
MKSPEEEFITIGEVIAAWGTEGKVKVAVATDFPQRFASSATVYINRLPVRIDSVEWRKGKAIIKFDTIDSIERAQQLQGQHVEIHRSQVYPLPEGQYYHFQLIGLEVWTTQGELVGRITEVLTGKSNDSYVVRGAKGEVLIPAIDDVIKSIDLDRGRITIEAIEGLLS